MAPCRPPLGGDSQEADPSEASEGEAAVPGRARPPTACPARRRSDMRRRRATSRDRDRGREGSSRRPPRSRLRRRRDAEAQAGSGPRPTRRRLGSDPRVVLPRGAEGSRPRIAAPAFAVPCPPIPLGMREEGASVAWPGPGPPQRGREGDAAIVRSACGAGLAGAPADGRPRRQPRSETLSSGMSSLRSRSVDRLRPPRTSTPCRPDARAREAVAGTASRALGDEAVRRSALGSSDPVQGRCESRDP